MGDWKAESIRRKYAPLPDDGPRHKKRRRRLHVRSDHKHEYEDVVIDCHVHSVVHGKKYKRLFNGERCKVCGRFRTFSSMSHTWEPPSDMRRFEVEDFFTMARLLRKDKVLPDELEVRK